MLKVYFDDVLIDNDYYTYLDNDYKFFDDNTNFRLGATACNTFKLSVDKSIVSSHPSEVKIDDGTSIFYLIVDSVEEDKFTYTYTLVDKLMLFNFYYDASEIIQEKADNEEDCYLSDILADMCEKAGVELDPDYEFQNDIVVTWYDNRKQAREYLSYIAELQYGYAQINEDGKLTFKRHNSEPVKTINIDECSDFVLGEGKTISRVVFDNGLVKYEFGDDTGATLYLNPENVYIINEEIVESIYNELAGFTFYNVSVPQCPIDSSVRAGDIILFTDGVDNYPTIAQYSLIYNGGWSGGYSLSVNTEKQQETQIINTEKKIKNIQTIVDRVNNQMQIVAETTEGNSQSISALEQTVDGFIETVQKVDNLEDRTTTIETNIDGMKQTMKYSGGYNLLANCVKQFGQAGWTGTFNNVTNTEIQRNSLTKSALEFMNDIEEREIQVPNGIYNFSCKYKKLVELANCKVIINNNEILLEDTEWTEIEYTFEVTANTIVVKFESDTDHSCWLVDLLFIPGDIKQTWTPNPNEINTGTIKLGGDTLSIEANYAKTKFEAKTDGIRIKNTNTNEVTTEYTDKGTKTKIIEADEGDVAKLLMVDMGNQTWISRL
jgi:hypothetical protein